MVFTSPVSKRGPWRADKSFGHRNDYLDRYDQTQFAPGIGSTWAGGADGMDLTGFLLTQLEVSFPSPSLNP